MHAELSELFDRAARSVLVEWDGVSDHDDVVQLLWEEYLTDKSLRECLTDLPANEKFNLVRRRGIRIVSTLAEANSKFCGDYAYSTHEVRQLLRGDSLDENGYTNLAVARDRLLARHAPYAEMTERRYDQNETGMLAVDRMKLSRALDALTEEMNREARRRSQTKVDSPGPGQTLGDGPGTRKLYSPAILRWLEEFPDDDAYERWKKVSVGDGRRQPPQERPKPPAMPVLSFADLQKRDPFYESTNRY